MARSTLDEIIREGTRKMLQTAIETEVDDFRGSICRSTRMERRISLSRSKSELPPEIESTARALHGADLTLPIAQTRPKICS